MAGQTSGFNNPGTSLPVAYAHTVDYFQEGIDQDGPFFKVIYWIQNFGDAAPLVDILLGLSVRTATGGTITRSAPHQHPLAPNLFCKSAVAEGVGQPILNSGGFPAYTGGARITAEYRAVVPYGFVMSNNEAAQQIDPATPLLWCTQELDFTTETVTVADSQVTWQAGTYSGKTVSNLAFRVRIPITIMNLTFHKTPFMPMGQIAALQGQVNLNTFLGQPFGTVLFTGCKTRRDFNSDGTVAQAIALAFHVRTGSDSKGNPQNWNYLPDPNLEWHLVQSASGVNLYSLADFSPLLAF